MIEVVIDGIKTEVEEGVILLDVAKSLGIEIPTLCYHSDLDPRGVCRICVVEIEGSRTLASACTYRVERPIVVKTYSKRVREARKANIDLLLATHNNSCTMCSKGGKCELEELANKYGSKELKYPVEEPERRYDNSSPGVVRDYSKCILCKTCIETCTELIGIGIYNARERGPETRIGSFMDTPLKDLPCINCGQCINRCPTGALMEKSSIEDVWKALNDPDKKVIIQTAPAPRVAIGEVFGYEPGKSYTYELNSALKHLGFDYVFDTCFTADLTIMEEGLELLERVERGRTLPQFTSCSPGWIKFIEHFYPQYLENLSSAKSPHEMFGAIIKTHLAGKLGLDPESVVVVSLMPCTAKKFEVLRPELKDSGYQDVDYVLTTREIGKMIKESGMELNRLEPAPFDNPYGDETGSGVIFASTGGVMESALRAVYHITTGTSLDDVISTLETKPIRGFDGVKYAEIDITSVESVPPLLNKKLASFDHLRGNTLRVAVAHGIKNAIKVLENIEAGGELSRCHFIEFMACPGGCIGGGGQPVPTSKEIREKRMGAVYGSDTESRVKASPYNEAVIKLYEEFFDGSPGGEKAHKLLHTVYRGRDSW